MVRDDSARGAPGWDRGIIADGGGSEGVSALFFSKGVHTRVGLGADLGRPGRGPFWRRTGLPLGAVCSWQTRAWRNFCLGGCLTSATESLHSRLRFYFFW